MYQDRWKLFIQAPWSSLNPPGFREPAKKHACQNPNLYQQHILINLVGPQAQSIAPPVNQVPFLALFGPKGANKGVHYYQEVFLVITRHHTGVMTRYCSRMKATSLPDLPKPTRTVNSSIRPEFLNPTILCNTKQPNKLHDY